MHRIARVLIWLTVGLLGALLALFLGANLYVQSQGTQTRIEQELSQRLHMKLRIKRISVTPWAGLKLTGITIPQANDDNAAPFLRARSFHLHVRFSSIFARPLIIREIALIAPAVTWPQNEAGKWKLPLTPRPEESPASEIANAPVPSASPLPSGSAAPVSPTTAPETVESPPITATRTETTAPQIKKIKLIDGSFYFLDHEQHNIALFEKVDFSSSIREGASIRGEARVAKILLRDRLSLSSFRSPIHCDPDKLELTGISARLAGGSVAGRFSLAPQMPDSPFTVQATFKDVLAEELLAEAGGPREMVRGVLEGNFDASGETARPEALTGAGMISLHNGHVQQFGVLAAIGQLLQIEELTQLDLQQAQAKYHLAFNQVMIDELVLQSTNLRLNATGTVSFDGKMALKSSLIINEKIRGQLFRGIRENFIPTAEAGTYALQFDIGGTLQKPKTNLMERVVGKDLKDLGTVFDALLGGHSKQKEKKERADTSRTIANANANANAVRVIAGVAGGLRLEVPKDGVRPTMDRVKAAIFSSLGARVIDARVLDLFAGSGGLGIEALSRGARSAVFVDSNRAAAQVIERNLVRAKLSGDMRTNDVGEFLKRSASEFEIILADPPYDRADESFTALLLRNIHLPRLLAEGGLFVLEKRPSEKLPSHPAWKLFRARKYGATEVLFFSGIRK